MGTSKSAAEVTVDVDLFASARWRGRLRDQAPLLAAVAVGGAVGASARYGMSLLWPTAPGAFPWTALTINVTGCAIMGIFMVLITDAWSAHRLLRPFIGTGVLGGYTTFSTCTIDVQHLVEAGRAASAMAYLALTPIAALTAAWIAAALTQRVIGRRAQ